jgi:hypothetical protein
VVAPGSNPFSKIPTVADIQLMNMAGDQLRPGALPYGAYDNRSNAKTFLVMGVGDVLLHLKTQQCYKVLSFGNYYSEYTDPDNPQVKPTDVEMVHYQALYGDKKKWFRPLEMFTADRFKIVIKAEEL